LYADAAYTNQNRIEDKAKPFRFSSKRRLPGWRYGITRRAFLKSLCLKVSHHYSAKIIALQKYGKVSEKVLLIF